MVELGGFYLDIIKDRQYTCKADSLARRSAQTALYHIVEALVRWIAPVLSFTADELWEVIPGKREAGKKRPASAKNQFLSPSGTSICTRLRDDEIFGEAFWQQRDGGKNGR